ncbi:MAG: hypothetical protein ISR75_03000 [Phycisphaerales bacterium]|nr:hypothetical protein [Planctomycetota bacterium]MBL6997391.1 hypothetical protein [Phycisphaerales bacterium]
MQTTKTFIASILTCFITFQASAEVIQVSNDSGSFELHSNGMNLFNHSSPELSTSDLAYVHSTLNSSGVTTNGKITLLPVHTSQGLSFVTLIDQEYGGGDTGANATLGVTSTASSSLGMFINDSAYDTWQLIQPPFGSQTLGATFVWDSAASGDGFAWTNLLMGDSFSYSFVDIDTSGAIDAEAFQFVGWSNDSWGVVSTNGFKVDGSSVFTGMVIPVPPTAALLSAFAFGYRRRRH